MRTVVIAALLCLTGCKVTTEYGVQLTTDRYGRPTPTYSAKLVLQR